MVEPPTPRLLAIASSLAPASAASKMCARLSLRAACLAPLRSAASSARSAWSRSTRFRPGGLKSAVTRDDMAFGIGENRVGKAECFDRCADLIDLALGMGARIARIGNELAHRAVGDDQPRRFYRRYFVHTGTLAKTIDRRKSAPLQLENAEKLKSGQVRSGRARSGRARSGQVRSGQVRSGQVRSGQ